MTTYDQNTVMVLMWNEERDGLMMGFILPVQKEGLRKE